MFMLRYVFIHRLIHNGIYLSSEISVFSRPFFHNNFIAIAKCMGFMEMFQRHGRLSRVNVFQNPFNFSP